MNEGLLLSYTCMQLKLLASQADVPCKQSLLRSSLIKGDCSHGKADATGGFCENSSGDKILKYNCPGYMCQSEFLF